MNHAESIHHRGLAAHCKRKVPLQSKDAESIIFDEPNKRHVMNCNAMNHMYVFVADGFSQPKYI